MPIQPPSKTPSRNTIQPTLNHHWTPFLFEKKVPHLQLPSCPGLVFLHPLLQHWFFGPEIWEQIAGVVGPTLAESPEEFEKLGPLEKGCCSTRGCNIVIQLLESFWVEISRRCPKGTQLFNACHWPDLLTLEEGVDIVWFGETANPSPYRRALAHFRACFVS